MQDFKFTVRMTTPLRKHHLPVSGEIYDHFQYIAFLGNKQDNFLLFQTPRLVLASLMRQRG